MEKTSILYNIEGCIRYSDINGVAAWLKRSKCSVSNSDYDEIVKKLASLVEETKIKSAILEKIGEDLSRIQKKKDTEEAEKRKAAVEANGAAEKARDVARIREQEKREKILEEQQKRMAQIKSLFISRYSPPCFYHFTDMRNLPSIREHGLLSLHEIKKRGIQVSAFGGNDWSHEEDIRRGLDRFVHLCFLREHPMEYVARVKEERVGETKFISVSRDVLQRDDIRLTNGVANSSGRRLLSLDAAVESMDFEVIYDRTDWKDPEIQKRRNTAKKYELLIPRSIPTEHLLI